MAKAAHQRSKDGNRKTYRLGFPADLDVDRVSAWIRSISGTLRSGTTRITGVPTVAFELWASEQGIVHLIKVPWQHADYVISQLRSLVPGIRVTPEEEFPQATWTSSVEVGLTNSSRTLRIYSPPDMAASLLAAVHPLEDGERILMQWVTTPAIPTHKPVHKEARSHEVRVGSLLTGGMASRDEVNDRREKLEEPNMLAVLRIGAVASTPERANHLIYRVRASLASSRGPSTRFVKRFVTSKALQQRIDTAAGSVIFRMQLSAPELASLIAWPLGNPLIAGLAPTMSRHIPAVAAVPRVGRVMGISNMPGSERDVAVAYSNAVRHTHVLGPTGVGKTTLLANMIAQDMEAGHGIVLVEGKGDLFEMALDRIPKHRLKDVIVLDVNDSTRPVGFNVLDQGNSRAAIDEVSALIANLYKDASVSIYAPQILYHMMHALSDTPGTTFVDLPTFLSPDTDAEKAWRDYIVNNIRSKDIRLYAQRYFNMDRRERQQMVQPLQNRIWQFMSRPEVKYILGQRTSSFQMNDVIANNKILLVNLNGIRIGQQTASIAGTMIVGAVWQAVRTVQATKENFLYLDEFHDFSNLPVAVEDMLAKARSAKLGTVLAHQHLNQLKPDLRSAVLANTATKIVFRTSAEDARLMAREFGKHINDEDFVTLGNHEAIARLATDDGVAPPLTMAAKPPGQRTGYAKQAHYLSRMQFGRAIEDVEQEIETRNAPEQKTRRNKPHISGEDWL